MDEGPQRQTKNHILSNIQCVDLLEKISSKNDNALLTTKSKNK